MARTNPQNERPLPRCEHPRRRNGGLGLAKLALVVVLASWSLGACLSPSWNGSLSMPGEQKTVFESQQQGVRAPPQWWKSFDSPELHALVDEAFEQNLDIEVALARLRQASVGVEQSEAAWWPQLDAELRAGRSRSPGMTGAVEDNQFGLGLAASYEIDLWGRTRAATAAARFEVEAAAFDVEAIALGLAAQIVESYFELLLQRELRDVLAVQIEIATDSLELLALRVGTSQASALDLLQQELQLTALREQLIAIEARERTQRLRLGVLLGRAEGVSVDARALPELPSALAVGVPLDLLDQRPDLAAARARAEAADARIVVAVANRLPGLRLSASASLLAANPVDLFADLFWSAVASVAAPLFDGGRRSAEFLRAEAVLDERLLTWAASYQRAIEEVERALVLEDWFVRSLDNVSQQQRLAEAALSSAREQFVLGSGDYFRVLGALEAGQRVVRQEIETRHQVLRARVALHRALGGDASRPLDRLGGVP